MPKPKKRTIYIFIIALITLYVVIEIGPFLTGALTKTEILKYGEIKVEQDVVCYLVRNETVFSAPNSGDIKYKFEEGSLVKKGVTVLTFSKDSVITKEEETELIKKSNFKTITDRLGSNLVVDQSFVAVSRGIFSTNVDGYEAIFTAEAIEDLTYEDVSGMSIETQDVARNYALKGEPLYKISDNSNWYMIFWIDSNEAEKYQVDATITVTLPDGDVLATVHKIIEDEDRFMVILKTNRYYKSFANERKVQASILLVNQRGLLISNVSLTTKDGIPGVYVKNTIGDYVFKPIRTISTDGEKTLVLEDIYYDEEGQPVDTVNVYDEVLKKPEANQ
jgi:putative membrane fusion protein